jgi:hypothetical protein
MRGEGCRAVQDGVFKTRVPRLDAATPCPFAPCPSAPHEHEYEHEPDWGAAHPALDPPLPPTRSHHPLERHGGRGGAVLDPQLHVGALEVFFHGGEPDAEHSGDFVVGLAAGDPK